MDTDNHNEMNAILLVDIQNAVQETESQNLPSDNLLSLWAQCAYNKIISFSESDSKSSEVTIRLVTELEMTTLNRDYRGQNKSTNVLSFAVDAEPQWLLDDASEMPQRLLGDIVICHAVIEQEAQQQGKTLNDHYAHMVTHGILHLCGYDHQDTPSAEEMEALETEILSHNAIANPYT